MSGRRVPLYDAIMALVCGVFPRYDGPERVLRVDEFWVQRFR